MENLAMELVTGVKHMNLRTLLIVLAVIPMMACFRTCSIEPECKTNIPEQISEAITDKKMLTWTLVDCGNMTWETLTNSGDYTLVWQKLVVCYDPTAQFWIYNEIDINPWNSLEQITHWLIYNVIKSSVENMLSFDLYEQFDNHKTPLLSMNQTNIFNIATFQNDLPNCSTLFLMTNKKRGNNAFFKKYSFLNQNDYNHDVFSAFLNHHYTVLLTTNDYMELVKFMQKKEE